MWRLQGAILLALVCIGDATQVRRSKDVVTPIEKVIGLLKDLEATVEKQGAKEAVQYDKYACFCKNQAKFKAEAIDRSKEKIKVLEAEISDLDAEIKDLNSDIKSLTKDISKLEEDIEKAVEKREKDHEEYLAKAKDIQEAIDACKEAIDILRASKKALTDSKLDLAQLKTVALQAKALPSSASLSEATKLVRQAAFDAQGEQRGDSEGGPAKSAYRSNDIIATIEELKDTFNGNKKDAWQEEYDANTAHEKKVLGWTNEKDFKTKEKEEKEVLSEEKTEEKMENEKAKDDETADKKSDEEFVKSLEASCEQKAKDWDQRSKARSAEMTALAEARATLEEGAVANYNSNEKLSGLVSTNQDVVKKEAPATEKPAVKVPAKGSSQPAKSPSFLQVRNVGNAKAASVQRLLSLLDSTATKIRSPVLSAVALKVQLSEDHFVKVRALIKDLIQKLKDDAKAEKTQKNFCDKEMGKAVEDRDKGNLNIEEENGNIAKNTALAEEKANEIEELAAEIAKLHAAILDAEQARKEEKANNAQAVADAEAGAKAVASALKVLKGFYKSAFAQVSYKPPKSDRSGMTVGDMAPEAFEGEYKGSTSGATGIIGILEVIASDFKRTKETTEKEEKEAAKDHKKFVDDSKDDIKTKEKSKDDAKTAKDDAEAAVVKAKDDLYDAEKLRDAAEAELEKLTPMCVSGEETYAERVEKRNQEIEALKEAVQILDDWQK